jgi:hypothetical protein
MLKGFTQWSLAPSDPPPIPMAVNISELSVMTSQQRFDQKFKEKQESVSPKREML